MRREKFTPKKIRRMLLECATPENKKILERFFREPVDMMGVKSPDIRRVSREAVKWCKENGGLSAAIELATPLWKKGKHEETVVAVDIIMKFERNFDETTWKLADEWVDDVTNWAQCDYLSADVLGALVDGHSDRRKQLLLWTKSANRWRRRASAVALVKHARAGKYLEDVFRVASPLMPDEDDMVRKGVGWLLREAARTAPDKVVDFCKKHEHHANRLILRTASETMSGEWKEKLLKRK